MSATSLRQIRYFITVARTGSFTAAAEILYVSQPAVGLQVKFLEDRLGMTLFERHSRGVKMTPAGQIYLRYAEAALKALDDAELELAKLRVEQHVSVRLGSTPTIAKLILPHVIHQSTLPGSPISITCEEGGSEKLAAMVRQSELDCAFCYEPLTDTKLACEPLFTEDLCLIGPTSVIGTKSVPIEFKELADLPLVLSPRPNNVRTLIDDLARQHGVAIEPAVELSLIGIKREFLIHFNYCAVLPSGLFLGDWDGGQISCRRIINPPVSRTMSLLFSRSMHAGVAASLVEMAKPYIAEHIAKSGFQWRLPEEEISRPETFNADDPPVPMYSGRGAG